MGLVVSRFRRKKSTKQSLEELEGRITTLERDGYHTEQRRRRALAGLLVTSVGLYVIALFFVYFYWRAPTWKESVFYVIPLLVSPFLIVVLRNGLARYYNWKLTRSKTKLLDMHAEKKRILEEVMDKETYKVAKELLDKFGGTEINPNSNTTAVARVPTPAKPAVTHALGSPAQLRQRPGMPQGPPPPPGMRMLGPPPTGPLMVAPNQMSPLKSDALPRPLMGGSGAFDRLVDYLVGDGPGSRYALICSHCKGHNGMALPEEFEYVSYRCAYCRFPNAARKQRPRPPPLTPSKLPASQGADHSSDSSDSEPEKERTLSPNGSPASIAESPSNLEAELPSDSEKDTATEKLTEEISQEPKTPEEKKKD